MPTYDYICRACGHEFELFQQMSEPVKRRCPSCGKPKLERLIGTGAGVLFKGGGFYETDYRSDSYTKAAEAEKKSAQSASENKSDPKSKETTPDSKPASSEAKAGGGAGSTTPADATKRPSSRKSVVKPSGPSVTRARRSKRK